MAVVGRANIFLGADTASFTSKMDKARRDMASSSTKMNKSLAKIDRGFKRAGAAAATFAKSTLSLRSGIALVTGAGGLGLMAKRAIDTADAISKASIAIGISSDALQEYRFALDRSGVAIEATDKGLKKFSRNMGELARSSSETQTALQDLDPALLGNLRSLESVEDQLRRAFRALAGYSNQSKRAAVAAALFGRAGGDMTIGVAKGIEAFEGLIDRTGKLNIILSGKLLKSAVDMKDELTDFGKVIDANSTRIFINFAPAIVGLTGFFADLTSEISDAGTALQSFISPSVEEQLASLQARLAALRAPPEPRRVGGARARPITSSGRRGTISSTRARPPGAEARNLSEEESLIRQIAALEKLAKAQAAAKKAAEETAAATDDQTTATEAQTKTIKIQTDKVGDFIAGLRNQNKLMLLDEKAREKVVAVQKAQQIAMAQGNLLRLDEIAAIRMAIDEHQKLTAEIEAQAEATQREQQASEERAREAERQAEEIRRPFINAAEDIQQGFTDAFFNIFRGSKNRDLVGNFLDFVQDAFARMLANMATLAILRPIAISLVPQAAGLFGIPGSSQQTLTQNLGGGSLFGGGGLQNLSSFLPTDFSFANTFQNIGSFFGFGSGATSGFDAGGFISAGGQFGPSGASGFGGIGAAGGITLLATIAKQFVAGATDPFRGTIDALLGPSIEQALADPRQLISPAIGLGGILNLPFFGAGGLFGKKESVGPNANATFLVNDGRLTVGGSSQDNAGNIQAAEALATAIADALNIIADLADLTFTDRPPAVGLFEKRGFFARGGGDAEIFATAEAAAEDAITRFLAGGTFTGDQAILDVIARSLDIRGGDLDETIADVTLALQLLGETGSALDQVLEGINAKYDAQIERARELGLATDGLARAREAEISLVRIQSRVPFTAAAAQIVDFINAQRLGPASTLSPTERLTESQRQFGAVLNQVREGRADLTGSLAQSAASLIAIGRENFASTVSFANLESNVISSLLSVAENFSDAGFVDQQIEATRQGTSAIVAAEAETTAAVEALKREIQLLRQQFALAA